VIVDSSALVAILLAQLGHQRLVDQLARAAVIGVGAPTLAQTGIVLTARIGVAGRSVLARLLDEASIERSRARPHTGPLLLRPLPATARGDIGPH